MSDTPAAATPGPCLSHLIETVRITVPIAVAQLGQMAMGLTDSVMLGGIGDAALAAGGLGASFFFTCLFTLQGVLSGTAVLAARARGAGHADRVPAVYWSGLVLAAALSVPMWMVMSDLRPLLMAAGEPAPLVANVTAYMSVLRWGAPAGVMGIGLVRGFLPSIGLERLMLWVIPGAVLMNAWLNVWLIYGGFGLPAFGMQGSAAATAITLWVTALALLALLHLSRHGRLVRPALPRLTMIGQLLAIGVPVGGTVVVEATLFLVTALMVGVLGPLPLAAHTVAISVASVTFMVPLAIAQAANVRVAHAAGAGRSADARRAGFVAIGLAAAFMGCAGLVMVLTPNAIVGIYLAHGAASAPLAARLLRVAAAFQIVDGVQVAASGALRGLKDTRVPLLLAAFGYWAIGFWLGRVLAFQAGLGVVGLWWGLFAGLATVAVCLTARFALFSRVTLCAAGAIGDRHGNLVAP